MSFDINIISTGSIGNCFLIDDAIMIDCGLPYQPKDPNKPGTKQAFDKAQLILITHRHGDHLTPTVIKKLHKLRPRRMENQLFINQDVLDKIRTVKDMDTFEIPEDHIIDGNSSFSFDIQTDSGMRTYQIETFALVHDVPNQGFVITNEEGETLIFATDTNSMEFAPRRKYDYIVVEGNYDEDKVFDDILSEDFLTRRRALRNLRHFSVQQFEDFVRTHSHKDTIVYQLHESGEYGIRSDLNSNT